MTNPPFADKNLLGTFLQLAYWTTPRAPRSPDDRPAGDRRRATFYDALPANVAHVRPVAPRRIASKRAPRRGAMQRWLAALDNWFYRQQLATRERYLSQAQNVFELEARMRELERRPYR